MSALKFKIGDVIADKLGTIGTIIGVYPDSPFPYNVSEVDGRLARHAQSWTMHIAPPEPTEDATSGSGVAEGVRGHGEANEALRSSILATANDLINGQRARDYGDAAENFQRIADLWRPVLGVEVTPEQVALCMTQLKIARLITSPVHQDSWIDACGYLALGGEIAGRKRQ